MDNFELVDNDLSTVSNAGRIHSNLIRLKKSSFAEISKKWTNFRIARLNKQLEKEQDKLNNLVNTTPIAKMEEKVMAKANKIAKLEEKIKILSREDVPSNYVSNRAIKLKDAMMKEVYGVSSEAYADSIEPADYGFTDFADTGFGLAAATDANVASDVEEKKDIDVDINPISREDIEDSINAAFVSKDNVESEEISEPVEETENEIKNEVVDNTVQENVTEEVAEESSNDVVEEVPETQEESIDIPVTPIEIEEKVEIEEPSYRVVSNEATPARVNKFDSEGNYKNVSNIYDPMSDEDLAEAREKIEFDKYEEKYANEDKNIRDEIVVVADRDEKEEEKIEEYTAVEDNETEEEMHFDYSDATVKDIANAVNFTTSSSDLQAMMARVAELKKKQAESKERMDEARRIKEEEARRAEESRIALEEKEKEKETYISKLNDYMSAMEDDIKINDDDTEAINKETENIRQIIKEQEMKKVGFDNEIKEINAVIAPEAINVKVVGR